MDVCINKPFKAILRKCWVSYSTIKLPAPTRQDMVDWIEKALNYLLEDPEIVIRFFDVCGIASTDPKKVRSAPFYQGCMEKAIANLNMDSLEDEEEDPFDLLDEDP